jgi:cardiolipin synthase
MLIKAAQRGVKISIVLSGKSDVPLMQNAMKFMYQEFLESGIELYEWKQSVLHAKLALFDAKSFTVGSYNLNHLSQFSSVETNLVSTNYEAYLQLQSILNTAVIPKCEPIDKERFLHKRTQLGSFFQYISYSLLISLFRLYQRFMYHQHNS